MIKYFFLLLLAACSDRVPHSQDGNNQLPPAFRAEPDPFETCTFVSSEPTGTKRYCGKACWRTLERKTYSCSDGLREIIE